MKQKGRKFDAGKPRWSLIPWKSIEDLLDVLEHGAVKYKRDNWKKVEQDRYVESLMRHSVAFIKAQENGPNIFVVDKDSGLPELACILANASFLLWFEPKKNKKKRELKRRKKEEKKRRKKQKND